MRNKIDITEAFNLTLEHLSGEGILLLAVEVLFS